MDYAKEIAKAALKTGAVKFNTENPFTWVSGYRMPIYVNLRQMFYDHENRKLVAGAFSDILKKNKIKCDIIAGTATAGIPHATTLSDFLKTKLVYVREKPKGHGMKGQIEGIGNEKELENKNVVVIEDVISTGGSSATTIQALRGANANVDFVLAIMDYGFRQSADSFETLGCKAISIINSGTLIDIATKEKHLTQEQGKILTEWKQDPWNWGSKRGFPKVEK